jgi:hypothetical protein
MNNPFAILALAALSSVAYPADFSVFKVCDDKHTIRTSDGADAGHIEYLVLEPDGRSVVAAIVTGGVSGTRLVSLPATSMELQSPSELRLPQIQRERLLSAPVIERASLLQSKLLRSDIVERCYTHFGAAFNPAVAPVQAPAVPAKAGSSGSGR